MHRMMTLDAYLRDAGLTEAEFAQTVGLSQSQIHRLRKGSTGASLRVLANIQKATKGKVEPNDFVKSIRK